MKIWKRPWNYLVAGALLMAFGAARLPFERSLGEEWERLHLRSGNVDIDVREKLSQMSFVAVLGGFRSLVASFLSLKAFTAWSNVDWSTVESTFELITTLQPRVVGYWDEYGWHMAYNASSYYRYDDDQRLAIRRYLEKEYIEKGIEVFREGIRNNPEDYVLYVRLGEVLRVKKEDHCGAAENFGVAAALETAPSYTRRFAAYELAECPGREREAFDKLLDLYREGPQHHKPTLIQKLKELEERLGVPPAERVGTESRQ